MTGGGIAGPGGATSGASGTATGGRGSGGTTTGGAGASGAGGVAGPGSGGGPGGIVGTMGSAGVGGLGRGGPAACMGKAGSKRGKSTQSLMAAGVNRTFIYYAPPNLDPNKPAPIVFVPHGALMSGQQMYDITGYAAIADREGFVAIFPDGEGVMSLAPWNVGTGDCGAGGLVSALGNDQAFIDAMLDFAEADQCIDSEHVYMTGFSMGGYFSHETGCLRTDIRAVGPHSGGTHDLGQCKSKHKPVIIFHFMEDALISYTCATDARDKWVARNGCTASSPDVTTVKGGTCEYYKGCPADGQVALCTFAVPAGSMTSVKGHTWSGGAPGSYAGSGYVETGTESAAELGWAFFKKYAW
jgi:polyhydroxybutyrate depolymerase